MVLESIMNPRNAEDKPWHVFILAFFYSFVAIFFAHQLFPSQSSILAISLITIIFVPFFQRLFEIEEKKECFAARNKFGNLFTRHAKIIYTFSAFFMGIILAMNLTYIFFGFEDVFVLQKEWFAGQGITGNATGNTSFTLYFINNSQVMILMFILSTMFGAGAIFILAWNASVISVYLGLIYHSFVNQGMNIGTAYFYGIPAGLGAIALHGIPEILAYFIAGLAGGILSVGIIREKIISKEFKKVFMDSVMFLVIAEALIFVAAYLEAYV
ncbi:MAG: stage II sporulation protein M [Candidatus Aenigmatarchaeota archaeon]